MSNCYKLVKEFKKKYPVTIAFRLKRHSEIVERHLNPDEKIIYAFTGQKNDSSFLIINTCVVALTNKRIVIGIKRLLWGYFFISITPDMFNDLTVNGGLIWGGIVIDTIKEKVVLTNIAPKALPEIESIITDDMMEEKKKYGLRDKKES